VIINYVADAEDAHSVKRVLDPLQVRLMGYFIVGKSVVPPGMRGAA
jgi:hypothetical protein